MVQWRQNSLTNHIRLCAHVQTCDLHTVLLSVPERHMSAVPTPVLLDHAQRISFQEGVFRPVVPQVMRGKTFNTSKFAQLTHSLVNALAGNAPALTDPTNGLVFPDLNASGGEDTQTNLIMPEPTVFLSRKFPPVSIIRPTATAGAAMGALKALTDDGLFIGQSPAFFAVLQDLAAKADAAQRGS